MVSIDMAMTGRAGCLLAYCIVVVMAIKSKTKRQSSALSVSFVVKCESDLCTKYLINV